MIESKLSRCIFIIITFYYFNLMKYKNTLVKRAERKHMRLGFEGARIKQVGDIGNKKMSQWF